MANRTASATITCPTCRTVYLAAQAGYRAGGQIMVDCAQCGPTPWRALLPQRQPLIVDRAALAAHRTRSR